MKTILLQLFFIGSLTAQSFGTLEGHITDAISGENMIFATVMLSQEEQIKYGTETNLDGIYKFEKIVPGAYDLKVQYIGYAPMEKIILIEPKSLLSEHNGKIENIKIEESSMVFTECVIVACKHPMITKCVYTCYGSVTVETVEEKPKELEEIKNNIEPKETAEAPSFEIFPNPATDQFTLAVREDADLIQIISSTGKVVKQLSLNDREYLEISLIDLVNGSYFVRMIKSGITLQTEKLVVMNY